MMKEESNGKLTLLFAKTALINEKKNEIRSEENDIVAILQRWFDDHKDEIEERYEDPIEWFGDWYRPSGSAVITLEFTVGGGDDSYYQRIHIFPDGHWEYPKYEFKTCSRDE